MVHLSIKFVAALHNLVAWARLGYIDVNGSYSSCRKSLTKRKPSEGRRHGVAVLAHEGARKVAGGGAFGVVEV